MGQEDCSWYCCCCEHLEDINCVREGLESEGLHFKSIIYERYDLMVMIIIVLAQHSKVFWLVPVWGLIERSYMGTVTRG